MYTKERRDLFVFGFILHAYVCAGEIKLSLQGATLSTNGSIWDDWVIERAIDGRTGGAGVCGCCTAIERPTWLQLNITQAYFVTRVVLKGRTDGAFYQLRNISMLGGYDEHHMVELQAANVSDTIRTYAISPPQAMQVIRVMSQLVEIDYMVICEIEVYRQEDCINGTFGPNCEKRCHCLEGPCEAINGTCGSRCQAGWRGSACNETCDNGWYGQGCLTQCGQCLNNADCNKTSGMCPDGCAAGYKGSLCIHACDHGWYGQGCLTRCGQCLNNADCNKTSGMCPEGCAAGYKGYLCKDECENGSHGLRCQNMCGNCQSKVPCNKVSGVCRGECEPGYKGKMCKDACDTGWYGQGCLTQCGQCMNNADCNKTSGVCPSGCAAGYKGLLCIHECENDWYGPGCENRCGNCKNKVPCDKISGVCPGDCEPCYYGTMCTVAEEKTTIELFLGELAGIILAAIAAGGVCSVVTVFCLRHRRRQTSSSNKMETHQGTAGSAYDALSPTTKATSHYDTLTITIPPTSSACKQIPTALNKVEEYERLQINQKTNAATYEKLSPNLATEEQYERVETY
ncbi:multiple epidermal growth factor-like domains protein 10 isoform X2 [Dreissena polymorpha]|uniref:multiple epidermal growth factor-like domains protein 10 isoform X2 n=1 Tax=Dreissena polymorpha TaxID=45954 RepID=UPI002263CB42|nr:multiple epidermal growth factor-like domains protein 10 isoform X2 [Dreissena polymorpha]